MRTFANRRWRGLDAFRGLAVIGMLLVNNPGNHDAVYAQLRHSLWRGCTIADLVFPFFLFVVGITTTISLSASARRGDDSENSSQTARIWRRTAIIFGVGILLNWFPFYQSGAIASIAHPNFFDRVIARLLTLRVPGVMQRIAVCYLIAALIARRASSRAIVVLTAALLIGYAFLLPASTFDIPSLTLDARIDRALFDWTRWGLGNHLWEDAHTWDPEGALSAIGALATVLLGVLCGRWMLANAQAWRAREMTLAGLGCIIAGAAWSYVLPFNKSLWTSSYVLFTGGIAMILLSGLVAVLDRDREHLWARPLIIFGENPLVAYAGSELGRHILHSSIKLPAAGGRLGTDEWVARHMETIGFSPDASSLAWALLYVAIWLVVLSRLSRRQLFVRA